MIKVGQIKWTKPVQPEHSEKYVYDSIYRLGQVISNDAARSWSIGWTFDAWGNRLTQTPIGLATTKVGTQTIGYTLMVGLWSAFLVLRDSPVRSPQQEILDGSLATHNN